MERKKMGQMTFGICFSMMLQHIRDMSTLGCRYRNHTEKERASDDRNRNMADRNDMPFQKP